MENRRTANVSFSCIPKERLSLQPLSVSLFLSHTPLKTTIQFNKVCAQRTF